MSNYDEWLYNWNPATSKTLKAELQEKKVAIDKMIQKLTEASHQLSWAINGIDNRGKEGTYDRT